MKGLVKRFFRLNLDSYIILGILCFVIFLIPVFPVESQKKLYNVSLLFIFLWAVLNSPRNRSVVLTLVMVSVVLHWVISPLFELAVLEKLASGINILVFLYVVVQLILDIAMREEVDVSVSLDAINGYLLLGLAFSSLIAYVHSVDPAAFNIEPLPDGSLADYTYIGFVTLTTLGYGDITPKAPLAKSIVILISIAGQLYIAIIIALLVGKVSARGSGWKKD